MTLPCNRDSVRVSSGSPWRLARELGDLIWAGWQLCGFCVRKLPGSSLGSGTTYREVSSGFAHSSGKMPGWYPRLHHQFSILNHVLNPHTILRRRAAPTVTVVCDAAGGKCSTTGKGWYIGTSLRISKRQTALSVKILKTCDWKTGLYLTAMYKGGEYQSWPSFNPLAPNDVYISRTSQLTSRCCILNIYSTDILTEYF